MRWIEYEEHLREQNRHVPADEGYLADLVTACRIRETDLQPETPVFRARLMPPGADPLEPFPVSEMGAPPPDKTPDGRVNPVGIPCFYGAFEPETAVAELRPWREALVAVATFKTRGRLRVVDFRHDTSGPTPPADAAWAGFMFSRPVHEEDPLAYVGTQVLASHLKAAGLNGILYGSALRRGGTNVALFDPVVAVQGEPPVRVWLVTDVTYDAEDVTFRPEEMQ